MSKQIDKRNATTPKMLHAATLSKLNLLCNQTQVTLPFKVSYILTQSNLSFKTPLKHLSIAQNATQTQNNPKRTTLKHPSRKAQGNMRPSA
jgi:hypothetical protein